MSTTTEEAGNGHKNLDDLTVVRKTSGDNVVTSVAEETNHFDHPQLQTTSMADGKCVSSSGSGELEDELERRASAVQDLATTYSRRSGGDPWGNPFIAESDSVLNPRSANFSAKEWAKAVVELVSPSGTLLRSAGVCFQNLSVHGFRAATDYHKEVGNIWLSFGAGLFQSLLGTPRPRVDILDQVDGLVRKGEMLVVLGPPGSGCSTFLKSIAGETNGIHIGEGSYFNYQGRP
jgi:ABC-type multidrug transport system fused ATPase/permease subunit